MSFEASSFNVRASTQKLRPLMNSHAQVILELPTPKEVSMIWDPNLSVSFSSQDFSRCTRSRERQSATNTPSYRCFPVPLCSSSASCATLPVHRSSPALNAVALKVQIPMLKATVWYLMTPWARHRGSLIATIPRTGQNFQCSALLPQNSISRLCARAHALRQNLLPRESARERETERQRDDLKI
jgi:hypothetical protein